MDHKWNSKNLDSTTAHCKRRTHQKQKTLDNWPKSLLYKTNTMRAPHRKLGYRVSKAENKFHALNSWVLWCNHSITSGCRQKLTLKATAKEKRPPSPNGFQEPQSSKAPYFNWKSLSHHCSFDGGSYKLQQVGVANSGSHINLSLEHLAEVTLNKKGQAICTEHSFKKGSFACEYNGEFINVDEAIRGEMSYTTEGGIFFKRHVIAVSGREMKQEHNCYSLYTAVTPAHLSGVPAGLHT